VYSYKPGVYTWLDNVLTPFWNWAVTLLPSWAAPNLVTFVGLSPIVLGTAAFLVQSPDLLTPIPRWQVAAYAFGLFFYQTMDAIDGKQARRTKSSSPLGQLFDHGCDALALLLCMVATAAALQLGMGWKVSPWNDRYSVIQCVCVPYRH
jgi:ethanolaminephosphotransferase